MKSLTEVHPITLIFLRSVTTLTIITPVRQISVTTLTLITPVRQRLCHWCAKSYVTTITIMINTGMWQVGIVRDQPPFPAGHSLQDRALLVARCLIGCVQVCSTSLFFHHLHLSCLSSCSTHLQNSFSLGPNFYLYVYDATCMRDVIVDSLQQFPIPHLQNKFNPGPNDHCKDTT